MEKDMIDRDLSIKNVVRYLMKEHQSIISSTKLPLDKWYKYNNFISK